jgi:D-alanyl-D-alanine carboxypeptidase
VSSSEQRLRDGLEEAAREAQRQLPGSRGVLLRLGVPGRDLDVAVAVGRRAAGPGAAPLDVDDAFHTASVAKTYTAAATLRAAELGWLDLDASVVGSLPAPAARALREHGHDDAVLTPRALLRHTAGLADYAGDEAWIDELAAHPRRVWSPQDLLEWGLRSGTAPVGQYSYSDTGYVVLAMALEAVCGMRLGQAYRELLGFEWLGLDRTWLWGREAPRVPPERMAHHHFGDVDMLESVDPSMDNFGGGGIAAPTADLVRIWQALLGGDLLRPESLAAMLEFVPAGDDGAIGLGIFEQWMGPVRAVGHTGASGAAVFTAPEIGATTAGSVLRVAGSAGPEPAWPDHPKRLLVERVLTLAAAL